MVGPYLIEVDTAASEDGRRADELVGIKAGSHNEDGYDLHSLGPDGKDGGDDDINNWSEN